MVSKLASFFKRRGGGGKGASPRCVADDDGINDNDAIPPMTIVEDDSSDEHYPSLGHKSNNNITKTYAIPVTELLKTEDRLSQYRGQI